ncbi:reverse transcriptase domain-containing protein [Tanacetum coccineum]
MHTRASNSELVEPLPEPERTLNRRLRPRNRRVPYSQRNPPQNLRIVYPPILYINYFRHFLDILRNYDPMDDEPMWATDPVVAPNLGSAITIPETANEFPIKGNHLTLVKGNQFDGRTKTDPHKHIHEFLEICDMFKYKDTENEVVRLMRFPLSLTGEAKTWLDELNEGTIETWDELRTAFISRFFPPALFDRLLGEIRAFSQHENESLTNAWLRMKEMLQNCHGHNLSKGNIIKIFYHGLSEITQEVLNAAAGGIFLYKIPNQAYQLLEDKVLLKLDWAKNQKTKSSLKKTVGFTNEGSSNSDTHKIMARMDVMTLKMDAQYKELQLNAKKNPILMKITYLCPEKKKPNSCEPSFDRLADKQSGRPSGSLLCNTQPNPKGHNSKAYQPSQSRNEHVNVVFTRSGQSYNPPVNLNDQQNNSETPINFDSDDEDEEPKPQPKTQNPKPVKETPLPKPYKPKIPLSSDYKKSQFNLVSYKAGLESVEARLAHYKKNEVVFEESINVLKLIVRLRDNALDEYKMKLDKAEKERDQLKQTLEKFQNSSKSLNDLLESQVIDKFNAGLGYNAASSTVESFVNISDKSRSDKGYHSVPPPLTGNFIPRKPNLIFIEETRTILCPKG